MAVQVAPLPMKCTNTTLYKKNIHSINDILLKNTNIIRIRIEGTQ